VRNVTEGGEEEKGRRQIRDKPEARLTTSQKPEARSQKPEEKAKAEVGSQKPEEESTTTSGARTRSRHLGHLSGTPF
jgi:hypothetical protein